MSLRNDNDVEFINIRFYGFDISPKEILRYFNSEGGPDVFGLKSISIFPLMGYPISAALTY